MRARLRTALAGLPPVFWALLAGAFVNRLGSFVATFLGLYLVRSRGYTAEQAAPVVALFGVGILVGAPVGGVLADALGRRATMLLSFACGAVAIGALGLVASLPALAVLTFAGAATGELYRPAMNAAIVDVVAPSERARAWGLSYWAMNAGWVLGLILGGFLAARSYAALFLADAFTTLLFALIVLRNVPETRPPGTHAHSPLEGLGLVLGDRTYVAFLLLHLVALTIFVQFQFALPLDMQAKGLDEQRFALVLVVNGLGVLLLQPLQAALAGKRDPSRQLAASALFIGLGYGVNTLAAWLPPLPVYVAGCVLLTIGEVLGFPYAAQLVAELAPSSLRGRYQGAFSMTWGLAFTLSPVVGGGLLAGLGAPALWLACLAAAALVALGHLAAGPARRRRLAAGASGPLATLDPSDPHDGGAPSS